MQGVLKSSSAIYVDSDPMINITQGFYLFEMKIAKMKKIVFDPILNSTFYICYMILYKIYAIEFKKSKLLLTILNIKI